jgi:hypothetical protein
VLPPPNTEARPHFGSVWIGAFVLLQILSIPTRLLCVVSACSGSLDSTKTLSYPCWGAPSRLLLASSPLCSSFSPSLARSSAQVRAPSTITCLRNREASFSALSCFLQLSSFVKLGTGMTLRKVRYAVAPFSLLLAVSRTLRCPCPVFCSLHAA